MEVFCKGFETLNKSPLLKTYSFKTHRVFLYATTGELRDQRQAIRGLIKDQLKALDIHLTPIELEQLKDLNHRPRFFSGFYVSVSHSKSMGVFAIGKGPCGVDVESKSRIRKALVERVSSREDVKNALEFPYLWTAKESAFKLLSPIHHSLKVLSEISKIHWQREGEGGWDFTIQNPIPVVGRTWDDGETIVSISLLKD